ncbi:MAG: (2Fe-2S)-binding protein [Acidobacteria bacterium]|nr:(2Fe-2S)-binding protein [Acidobacteriota bacterium]
MAEKILLWMTVNGEARSAEVFPMARLLDVIREDWGLTGTKEGCGEGECGACSVILDGVLVNACLIPAVQAQGGELLTVEGLARKGELDPLQEAFLHHGGAQCGFCTPGMLMAGTHLLAQGGPGDEAEARAGLAGNLCRCTGYNRIVDAVLAARREHP